VDQAVSNLRYVFCLIAQDGKCLERVRLNREQAESKVQEVVTAVGEFMEDKGVLGAKGILNQVPLEDCLLIENQKTKIVLQISFDHNYCSPALH